MRWLPRGAASQAQAAEHSEGFVRLLSRPELLRMLSVAFSAFFVFSGIFNYVPFYLSGPPFQATVRMITLVYLAYLMGIPAGPLAGKLTNRFGAGTTLIGGSVMFGLAICLTLVPSLLVIPVSLALTCAAFFTMHAAAVGSLNARLTGSRGRANSLYVLLYYLGGASGISATGGAYARWGWHGAAALGLCVLLVPLSVGVAEAVRRA
jgi:YNFM family putative membrane transporter